MLELPIEYKRGELKDEDVIIEDINVSIHPNGGLNILALGSDKNVYAWDYNEGAWVKHRRDPVEYENALTDLKKRVKKLQKFNK